jgi:urate oxidase
MSTLVNFILDEMYYTTLQEQQGRTLPEDVI